ncbi:helix-turn-helix domain-containing protein [Paenibacillus ginsengarvi]|uniref:AraC family transcriptional regulator n=1 Tax=Paenibacillus ginsengarvi TaxID=400777 RepID=A0A3B0CKS7_9BACL|nr:AraC family transcriptional regulator [Paenibacillus ginsengarvi]RKN86295.1 AraC family transcriptional regulator [Paenibacillus ginsengarvi]
MHTEEGRNVLIPQLTYCRYWERKDKFLFYEDTCKEWTIFAVVDGSFQYEFNNEKGIAAFGDLIVCPANTVLRRVVISPLTFFAIRVRWRINDMASMGQAEAPRFIGKTRIADTKRLAGNYALMKQSEGLSEEVKLWLCGHYMQDIWLLYGEECSRWPWPAKWQAGKQPEPIMNEASSLIRKHAFETFDLKEIAAQLQLSPARLCQKFKASFGQTPSQFLTDLRLEKARQLLLETTMTLDQISEYIGYQNAYYLSHIFKKHTGVTPSSFRKTHRV